MWNSIKSYLGFYSCAWAEFKRSGGYKIVKAIHNLARVIIFVILGIGLFTVFKNLYPFLSGWSWMIVGLVAAIFVLLVVVEFLRRFHERTVNEINVEHASKFSAQNMRAINIEKLTFPLGMARQLHRQIEYKEPPSREALDYLAAAVNQALLDCFNPAFVQTYEDGLSPTPDSMPDKERWVNSHINKLAALIDEQRQKQLAAHMVTTQKQLT